MRIRFLGFLMPLLAATCMAKVVLPTSGVYLIHGEQLEPMSPSFTLLFLDILKCYNAQTQKRDALQDNLESLLESLQRSGVILDVLHEIASSSDQMNTLSNYIYQALVSISTNTAISGLNITVNVTEVLQKVQDSGIITSTLSGLLINETQRNTFSDNLGEVLVNNTWISKLIYNTGETGKISWETIFDLARNTKSQDPFFNGTSFTYKARLRKREDTSLGNYSGSLLSFINNLVGSVIGSDLAASSFDSILGAVQGSGILVPTVQEVLGDQSIQKMVGFIANKLYNYGVFDQIPINDLFQRVKNDGLLSDTLQKSFADDLQSYVIGNVLFRLEQHGVFTQIQRNLYGSN